VEHKIGYDIGGSHSNVRTIQVLWDASLNWWLHVAWGTTDPSS